MPFSLAYHRPGNGLLDNLTRQVYDRQIGDARPELWGAYFNTLAEAITDATGQDWKALDYRDRDFLMLKSMRRNAAEFAAAKTGKVVDGMKKALQDGEAFSDFSARASGFLEKHQEWLRTEYDLALANAQMGVKWHDMTEGSRPESVMLRYQTVGDKRVRPQHRALDNTTLPASDSFWNEFYPPLDYRCRCTVIRVEGAAPRAPLRLPTDKEAPPEFRFNPGKTGQLFGKGHPYFDGMTQKAIDSAAMEVLAGAEVFDVVHAAAQATVTQHPLQAMNEVKANLSAARALADEGTDVRLLAYLDQDNRKNPDAYINGMVADIKTPEASGNLKGAVQKAIEKTSKQGAELAVIDLRGMSELRLDIANIVNGLMAGLQPGFNQNVNSVWILTKGRVLKMTRHQIEARQIPDFLKRK